MKIITKNKKAYFKYQILERFEAGISLIGQEVKSIKTGRINLAGAYAVLRDSQVFLIGAKIPPYQPKNAPPDYNPERSRKLLLKKSEIKYLIGKTKQKGLTIVPISVYIKGSKIKIGIAVARGKTKPDKREQIKRRETEKEIKRELKKRG